MQDPNALLKQAVSEITNYINTDKLSPHDAVKKVAGEMNLNVNFIKRASEVINVALTYNHFKKNAGARDQDFPIVDAQKVASEIYGTQEAPIENKKANWFNSPDEIPDFNKFLSNNKFKQAFTQIKNSSENYDSFPLSIRGAFDKTSAYLADMERVIDDLKTKKANETDAANKTFFGLVGEFAKDAGYRSSFETFEKDAYTLHGNRATPYIEFIHQLGAANEKRATDKGASTTDSVCKEAKLFTKFLEHVDNLHKVSAELEAVEANYKEDKQKIQQAYFKVGEAILDNFDKVQADTGGVKKEAAAVEETIEVDPVKEAVKAKLAAAESTIDPSDEARHLTPLQSSTLPPTLKKAIIASKKSKVASSEDTKIAGVLDTLLTQYQSRTQPGSSIPTTSHQDNLDRRLMLQNMMKSDDVLSSVDPKRVADAYEQFLHLAPELSKERDVVRGALRAMINSPDGAISPFDAQQFIEANTAFARQRLMQEGKAGK